jgi:hypothetical protein
MRLILIALLLATSSAWAQTDPMMDWTRTLTAADRTVMRKAVEALAKAQASDPATAERLKDILPRIDGVQRFDLRDMGFLGMALSRASADPTACALLRRIEPTSVCVK